MRPENPEYLSRARYIGGVPAATTVILGLGNPIRSDDAAGIEAARLLAEDPPGAVDVKTSVRGGLDLIDLLSGYERAVIIDCIVAPGGEHGRVRRLSLSDIERDRALDTHGLALPDMFALARRLGIPMPSEVVIFGIEASDAVTLSERLTEPVRSALPQLLRQVRDWLNKAQIGSSE